MIHTKNRTSAAAFTLVEMLVAMAVTLLMMAALARSFGYIGEKVRDSRGNLALSSQLVDISSQISNDLKRSTVTLEPVLEGEDPPGYTLYAEGPVTNVTSSIFNAGLDAEDNLVLNGTRYGDFDDYLAFTAVADGNNWFTGKVPRFVLDQKTAELAGNAYSPTNFSGNPLDPIVIRSKYAEIIYFASPEYAAASMPDNLQIVLDGVTNLPTRIQLHRRVLLIRPDLNLSGGMLPAKQFNENGAIGGSGTTYTWFQADSATGSTLEESLYAMAAVHQQCDLSIRRVDRTRGVAANSLADLSKPQNRFAHVRVPGSFVGIGSQTTMPLLALGSPPAILRAVNDGSGTQVAPFLNSSSETVATPSILSGFLRPEFVLGEDKAHSPFGDPMLSDPTIRNSVYGINWLNRKGEDVLTNNALALDVQIYDPDVSLFTASSSGLVVGPNDAGYRFALRDQLSGTSMQQSNGGFVDLAYPVLAGGSLRGWQDRLADTRLGAAVIQINSGSAEARTQLVTPFSGVQASPGLALSDALQRSGRLVSDGSRVRIFQPAFDTYSRFYETDGEQQINGGWSTASIDPATIDLGADGIDGDGIFGADDLGERETLPPFPTAAEAIKVTVRLENPSTRQIRQSSVIHRD